MQDPKLIEQIAEAIREVGYKAQIDESASYIISSTAGLRVTVYYYGPETGVQFHCGIAFDDSHSFSVEDCNSFNERYRWAKAYVAPNRGIAVELDYPLDTERVLEDIAKAFEIWETSLALFKQAIAEAQDGGDAEADSN